MSTAQTKASEVETHWAVIPQQAVHNHGCVRPAVCWDREAPPGFLIVSIFLLFAAEHFPYPFRHGVDGACGFPFRGHLCNVPD